VGETCYLRRDPLVVTDTTRWARGYVYFNALPSTDANILSIELAGGNSPNIKYRTATQDIIAAVGTTTTGATAMPITTGVWYRIEVKADASGSSTTMSLMVDGVSKGTATRVQAASTVIQIRIGAQTSGGTGLTADIIWDDFITGVDIAEWAVGDGRVVGLKPNVDGAHSFSPAGQFIYNAAGGNIDPAAEDVYTYLDHTLGTITDFINAALATSEEYIEVGFEDLPPSTFINGVEVVSAHHAATTTTNLQSMKLVDGGTLSDVFVDADFSQTGLTYHSKHYSQAPASVDESTGIGWSSAGINGLKIRWGSSWATADVNPDAYLDGVMLEVDFIQGAGSTGSGSPVKTLSKTASGTASQKFSGDGTAFKTLVATTPTDTASQRFNASGTAARLLSAFAAGTASEKFSGSGTPSRRLSAFAMGLVSGSEDAVGFGSPVATLHPYAIGTAYSRGIPSRARGGGKIRFIGEPDLKPEIKKRKRPKPKPAPEAKPLADHVLELPMVAPPGVDPGAWRQAVMAARPLRRPQKPETKAPEKPRGTIEDQLLQHFLLMIGAPALADDDDLPFMLKRFLQVGK
jgi:hypothetical protein